MLQSSPGRAVPAGMQKWTAVVPGMTMQLLPTVQPVPVNGSQASVSPAQSM
jgi:hypothetical protein